MTEEQAHRQLTEDSPSVRTHLGILQGVIERMARNSTSCKTWCIALVSAVLVVIADKEKPDLAFLGLFPTAVFQVLDAYYLALEKGFRNSYRSFVTKLHNGTLRADDLYSVAPEGQSPALLVAAMKSYSVWGFYGYLAVLIIVARSVVLR